ncbi:hypothetical protein PIB30_046997 [Stylosanthes scabra]|uniref:Uncharacterized protein n=1 Tax=Stylosanthes scabra TaxID=79078 RepID=A0ABU6XFF7_9FABA|nr:hypothetical protein [Stylosanthes scabra]
MFLHNVKTKTKRRRNCKISVETEKTEAGNGKISPKNGGPGQSRKPGRVEKCGGLNRAGKTSRVKATNRVGPGRSCGPIRRGLTYGLGWASGSDPLHRKADAWLNLGRGKQTQIQRLRRRLEKRSKVADVARSELLKGLSRSTTVVSSGERDEDVGTDLQEACDGTWKGVWR